MSPFLRFMLLMLAIDLVGFFFAGVLFPASRTGQLVIVLPTLAISPVIAFVRVYGTDIDAFTNPFNRSE